MFLKYAISAGTVLAMAIVGATGTALAKVEGDTITLGSALSLTGKYATNGLHTQRGYDFRYIPLGSRGAPCASYLWIS